MTARNEQQKKQKIANYLTTKIQITSIIIEGLKCNKSAGTAAKKNTKNAEETPARICKTTKSSKH